MAKDVIQSIALALVAFATAVAMGQSAASENPGFNPKDYPEAEFQVTQSTHMFEGIKIRIVQARRRKTNATPPSYCRAWVYVSGGAENLRSLYYGDIDPVGGGYGIFVPAEQPSSEYFVMVKEGDYDGHLLLFDKQGQVTDLLGGFFFLASDGRFLVSQYSSDESGLSVFDFQRHRPLLQSKDIPYIENWYKDDLGYFFTEAEWTGASGYPHEKPGVGYRLDLKEGQVVPTSVTASELKSAVRVKYDFDPRQSRDCMTK